MSEKKQAVYEFHQFQLNIGKGVFLRCGQPVTLQWKTFELLCTLVKSNGRLLTRDELIEQLWADTFVEDNNLSQHIRALRKILGDGENGALFIETVPRRGYRFLPEVLIVEAADENQPVVREIEADPHRTENLSELAAAPPAASTSEPGAALHASANVINAKNGAFAAPADSAESASNNGFENARPGAPQSVAALGTFAGAAETSRRRKGLRRAVTFSLWGFAAGAVFLALLKILQFGLAELAVSANPAFLPAEAMNALETILLVAIFVAKSGYFAAIGLFLFGIARLIYALFEKEEARLAASTAERWMSIVFISTIAAVAIPNLISSFREARERHRAQKQNSAATRQPVVKEPKFLDFSNAKYLKVIENQQGRAAISPDGKFIVYTDTIGGKQTLWLRQIAANTNIQILPPTEADYRQLRFSHDGEYIYFNHKNMLYRISVLGGESMLLLKDVAVFSLSPDGRQFVFNRRLPDYQCGLFISAADGSAERLISKRQNQSCYKTMEWSPDGRLIAFAAGQSDTGDANTQLLAHRIADGAEFALSEERWFHVHNIVWLPDQSGLLLCGSKQLGKENPLWQVNYPGGETRPLTDGLVRYIHLSLTADGSRLLASQSVLNTNLSIAPGDAPSELRKAGSAFYGLTWLPDGKIVYSSSVNKNSLWVINADGTGQKQLTFDDAGYLNPFASPDGRYIFYTLENNGPTHIWRMNADGSGKIQLTRGSGEQKPNVSADGKWLFYQVPGTAPTTIWKISTDGDGDPVQITKDYGTNPSVSPDGTSLAYFKRREPAKDILEIAVMSLATGQIVKTFSLPDDEFIGTSKILWTKDGKAVIYTRERIDRIANIWVQPLDGAAAKQITDYSSERIFDFGWSPDGAHLAVIRGSWKNEAFLISGFK